MYRTTCPKCGAEDSLYVVSGYFRATRMFLTQDGFSPMDAKQFDTEDEKVECDSCGATFDLGDLDLDLEEPIETDSGSQQTPATTGGDAPMEASPITERDPGAKSKAAEAVCDLASRLVRSKHHVSTLELPRFGGHRQALVFRL
ncbi:MAG: hypothetical protein NUW23_15490, partial [Firmicutes bacterium]|nr:hypothetical protein [Bacillota bacterium]